MFSNKHPYNYKTITKSIASLTNMIGKFSSFATFLPMVTSCQFFIATADFCAKHGGYADTNTCKFWGHLGVNWTSLDATDLLWRPRWLQQSDWSMPAHNTQHAFNYMAHRSLICGSSQCQQDGAQLQGWSNNYCTQSRCCLQWVGTCAPHPKGHT